MQSIYLQVIHELRTIPDGELLRRLAELLAGSRHTEADLVAHIGEVDARRLYAGEATPSMFAYCTERLHLSEAETCLRIAAARASREHPAILEMLADGRLHLSAIARLAPHLTPDNRDELLRRATHKTKREVDELVAELAPRPDVPTSVRKLPAGRFVARPASQRPDVRSAMSDRPGMELRPERVDWDCLDVVNASKARPKPDDQAAPRPEPNQERAAPRLLWVAARPTCAVIEPLAPTRYKVQFTASAELRDKLERLQGLMRSLVPDGDLAAIIDAAVTEKLERLEARRFGKAKSLGDRPRRGHGPGESVSATDTTARTRRVPAAVKRAVHQRDEGRCRYVDAQGRRCTGRVHLEFHHRKPWAVGGDHSLANVGLLCHAHNRYLAEIDYGETAVGRHRRLSAGSPGTQIKPNTG